MLLAENTYVLSYEILDIRDGVTRTVTKMFLSKEVDETGIYGDFYLCHECPCHRDDYLVKQHPDYVSIGGCDKGFLVITRVYHPAFPDVTLYREEVIK